jgi:deoxyribonuclease I
MKKILLALMLLAFAWALGADYYENIGDLNQQALLNALRNLISTNTYSSYDGAKDFLFQELDNDNGTVRCVYTGETYNISSSYNGQSNPNTEHSYAQSWFSNDESSRKKADLHHLFITTMQVNSSRGNLPFNNVASTASATVYYTNTPWQSYRGYDNWQNTVFEPADVTKGNIARALLYFYVRYDDGLTQGGVNMIPVFRQWHHADPPDAAELARNQAIQSFQTNRNPFVDHPEYVERIWCPVSNEDWVQNSSPSLRIDNVYPNPFRDNVQVIVDRKQGDTVHADVYNVRGAKVYSETLTGSDNRFHWNGRDMSGNKLSQGIYFIRFTDGVNSVSTKTLLLQ